jgi:hypothetical protein
MSIMSEQKLPAIGSHARKLYDYLLDQEMGTELGSNTIAHDITGANAKDLPALLNHWVERGVFVKRQEGGKSYFSLGLGTPVELPSDAVPAAGVGGDAELEPQLDESPFACALYSDGDLVLLNAGADGDVDITLPKAQASALVRYLMSFAHEEA